MRFKWCNLFRISEGRLEKRKTDQHIRINFSCLVLWYWMKTLEGKKGARQSSGHILQTQRSLLLTQGSRATLINYLRNLFRWRVKPIRNWTQTKFSMNLLMTPSLRQVLKSNKISTSNSLNLTLSRVVANHKLNQMNWSMNVRKVSKEGKGLWPVQVNQKGKKDVILPKKCDIW